MIDSTPDTLAHIQEVQMLLAGVIGELSARAAAHDVSKLVSPEKEVFDRATPRLRGLTYGSHEYKAALAEMSEGLQHHYRHNRHHPEHFEDGVMGMTLIDLLEMLCDWKAATKRHADGDIWRSLQINAARFGIDEQLLAILANTVRSFRDDGTKEGL